MCATGPTEHGPDDRELLLAFRQHGDRSALLQLFLRHAEAAYRLVQRLGADPAEAEDAVQEGYLAVVASIHTYRGSGTPQSWLLSVVANTYRQQARSERRRQQRQREAAAMMAMHQTPDEGDATASERAAAVACLAELPERYRLPVSLHCMDGWEFADMATVLGVKEKTLRSQVSRGLDLLRGMLAKRGVALSSVALTGALHEPPQLAPEQLVAGLRGIADKASPPPAPLVASSGWLAAAVAAVAVLACVAMVPGPAPSASPADPVIVGQTRGPVQAFLVQQLRIGFRNDAPDAALARVLHGVPADRRVPVAYPARNGRLDGPRIGSIDLPIGDHDVGSLLQCIATASGLELECSSVGVSLVRRLPRAEREALLARNRQGGDEVGAGGGDPAVLRELVLELAGPAGAARKASRALLSIRPTAPYPQLLAPQHVLQTLSGDAACASAIRAVIGDGDADPEARRAAIWAAGWLRLTDVADRIEPIARNTAAVSRDVFLRQTKAPADGRTGESIQALGLLGHGRLLSELLVPDAGASLRWLCAAQESTGDARPLLHLLEQGLAADARTRSHVLGVGLCIPAIGRTGDARALPLLQRIAEDGGPPASEAVIALASLHVHGCGEAAAVLVSIAGHALSLLGDAGNAGGTEDPGMACRDALSWIRRPGLAAELAPLVERVPDERRRQVIHLLLIDDADAALVGTCAAAVGQPGDAGLWREGMSRLAASVLPVAGTVLAAAPPARDDHLSHYVWAVAMSRCRDPNTRERLAGLLREPLPARTRRSLANGIRITDDPALSAVCSGLIEQEADAAVARRLRAALAEAGR